MAHRIRRRARLTGQVLPDLGQGFDLPLLRGNDLLGKVANLRVDCLLQRRFGGGDRHLVVRDSQVDEGQIRVLGGADRRDLGRTIHLEGHLIHRTHTGHRLVHHSHHRHIHRCRVGIAVEPLPQVTQFGDLRLLSSDDRLGDLSQSLIGQAWQGCLDHRDDRGVMGDHHVDVELIELGHRLGRRHVAHLHTGHGRAHVHPRHAVAGRGHRGHTGTRVRGRGRGLPRPGGQSTGARQRREQLQYQCGQECGRPTSRGHDFSHGIRASIAFVVVEKP